MLFNIYYINFPKVYEIKMMLSNLILLSKEFESNKNSERNGEVSAKIDLGTKFLNLLNIDGEAKGRMSGSKSQKVLETFEVKTTKSVILNDIIENSRAVNSFNGVKEGELVRIENVSLSLENETELRVVKLFTSDAFKGLNIPNAGDMDIGSVFNSMFKDYAYKLKGTLGSSGEELIIKIPLTFESEFESSYSVDDLFIGKVSVVGLYKGTVKLDELKNSLEFFQEIGSLHQMATSQDDEIQNSQYDTSSSKNFNPFFSLKDENSYHYIDLLSIIQIINTPESK